MFYDYTIDASRIGIGDCEDVAKKVLFMTTCYNLNLCNDVFVHEFADKLAYIVMRSKQTHEALHS